MGKETKKVDGRVNNGGARVGAGRKLTGAEPKKALGTKVSKECRDRVKTLAKESGRSQAYVVETMAKKITLKDLK